MILSPVDAGAFPAPREQPLGYPGKRPHASFVLAGDTVFPLTGDTARPAARRGLGQLGVRLHEPGRPLSLDQFLQDRGVARTRDRYAVVGYGSNPVPGQLLSKFGPDAVVPVLRGQLLNADVVYNLASNFGYAYADLVVGDHIGACEVGVTLLDDAQMALMAQSEQNYQLSYAPRPVVLASGQVLREGPGGALYLFAGFRPIWTPRRYGVPVAVQEIPCDGRSAPSLTHRQALALAIEEFGLHQRHIGTPDELSAVLLREHAMVERAGKLKFDLQDAIGRDPRSHPALVDVCVPLGSFDQLKRLHHLESPV